MDPLTHGVAGAVMAQAGCRQRWGRQAMLAMVGGAMLPDIDVFWSHGVPGLETHRGITHSLVGAVGLAGILGTLLLPLGRERRWWLLSSLSLVAIVGGHLFLDLINNYGIQLFLPFSNARPALDLVFIVDPFITVPLLLALAAGLAWRVRAVPVARAALVWVGVYLGAMALSHALALVHLERTAAERRITPLRISALPEPLHPLRWAGFVEDSRHYWHGTVSAWGGPVVLTPSPKPETYPTAAMAAQSSDVKTYLWFARFPALSERVEDGRRILDYEDLRFAHALLGPRPFGRLRVILSASGAVERVLFNP
jgi:inner membrane protein